VDQLLDIAVFAVKAFIVSVTAVATVASMHRTTPPPPPPFGRN